MYIKYNTINLKYSEEAALLAWQISQHLTWIFEMCLWSFQSYN